MQQPKFRSYGKWSNLSLLYKALKSKPKIQTDKRSGKCDKISELFLEMLSQYQKSIFVPDSFIGKHSSTITPPYYLHYLLLFYLPLHIHYYFN